MNPVCVRLNSIRDGFNSVHAGLWPFQSIFGAASVPSWNSPSWLDKRGGLDLIIFSDKFFFKPL
jgi:hypothetical protein